MDSSQPQAKTLPGNLWSFVWRYMKVRKLFIAAMLFVGIAWSVEMVTKPYLLKIIIDTATESNDNSAFSTIMLLGLIYLVVMFVGVLVTNFYNYIGLKLYPRLTVEITRDVFKHLMMLLIIFFRIIMLAP